VDPQLPGGEDHVHLPVKEQDARARGPPAARKWPGSRRR
jgi:hypothetical protein